VSLFSHRPKAVVVVEFTRKFGMVVFLNVSISLRFWGIFYHHHFVTPLAESNHFFGSSKSFNTWIANNIPAIVPTIDKTIWKISKGVGPGS
jgi:hypothetical protein